MIKLPLKKSILLLTTCGKYICRVIYANDEVITCVDVHERILTPIGEIIYSDYELGGKIIFDRRTVTGYKPLDEVNELLEENEYQEKLNKTYEDAVAESRRKQWKVIRTLVPKENPNKHIGGDK